MSTKYRIIFGFFIVVVLTTVVGFIAYNSSTHAVERNTEYDRLSRFNVATSDLTTALGNSGYSTLRFLNSGDSKDIENALKWIAEAEKQIKICDSVSLSQTRKNKLAAIEADRKGYKESIILIQKNYSEATQYTNTNILAAITSMEKALNSMAVSAKQAYNVNALYTLSEVNINLAAARFFVGRFSQNRNQADGETMLKNVEQYSKSVASLQGMLVTEEAKATMDALQKNVESYQAAVTKMYTLILAVNKAVADGAQFRIRQTETALELSQDVDKSMNEHGAATKAALNASQAQVATISSASILIGILCATLIIWGLVKTLNQLAVFSSSIAAGNFNIKLDNNEKGEIGAMIAAIREIPAVLSGIMAQIDANTRKLAVGHFRDRLDTHKLNGSFSDLAKNINEISNTYTNILDVMPTPLMACEKDNKIIFLNKAAQNTMGGNCDGRKCSDMLNAPQCNTPDCLGLNTMQKNTSISGETTVYPQGKQMEVSVMAIPLHDVNGQVAGFMEVLTDLSVIKNSQKTMMAVAGEASAIADRVATAAEQLSAQVEQISRGSEVQRTRMETTVSAMVEMNSTVMEVARNAGQAAEQSENTRNKAQSGAQLVNKVVQSINAVNSVATKLQSNMQELGSQAESIGGVMNVISDIADQTNLLALNAAIEAARAGEAGRGFAVVADEVRKLAEKTMTATKEVGDSIHAIQNSAQVNINEVNGAVKSVKEATELSNSSGDALREIVDLAASNSGLVASIATAAEEQSATSEEINRSLDEINKIVGETTDGMVQSSNAVQELSHTAQQLKQVMQKLR